jgi:hypothetical protein
MKKSGSILLVLVIVIFSGCQPSQQKQAPDISNENPNLLQQCQQERGKIAQQADAAKLLAEKTSADLREEVARLTKEIEQLRAEIERLKVQPPPVSQPSPPPQTLEIKKGCEYVAQAFMRLPCQISAIELLRTADIHPEYRNEIVKVLTQYFDDFVEKQQAYKKQNNYREKMMAAAIIANYLININSGNPGIVNKYKAYVEEFKKEQQQIANTSRW